LLFHCYRKFYSAGHILNVALETFRPKEVFRGMIPYLGHPLFTRFSVWKKMHPMSGGVRRVSVDSYSDYRELRRERFDVDVVPLPKNLELSKADEELNRRAKVAI
jgi:hypothetical protein